MAKNSIRDYSNTAASNTDVQNVNIDEGCAPSGINNAIREVMADLADVNDGTVALETPVADSFSTDTISEKTSATGVTVDGVLLKDSEVTTDTINEKTSATGVTIDGVLLKDSEMNGSYLTDGTVATAKIADNAVDNDKLSHVNSNTGSFGDSSTIPNFTVNAQGRITAAGEAALVDYAARSLSASGHLDFSNGFQVHWGSFTATGGSGSDETGWSPVTTTHTFANDFPTACVGATAHSVTDQTKVTQVTRTSLKVKLNAGNDNTYTVYYVAFGY